MISLCTAAELPTVVDLAEWFYYQQQRPGKFDREVWVKIWTTMLDASIGFILQRTSEGRPAEAIGVMLYPDPNNGQLAAYSGFWYITGESKSLAGGLLYHELERILKERGVQRFFMTALLNQRENKVSQYMLRSGFLPVEVLHVKELSSCQ
jgi:hypothetical protein